MKEIIESPWFIMAAAIAVAVSPLIGLWKLRARRGKKTDAEQAVADERYEKGLRQPDHTAFVARYGCPAPPALRQLYESSDRDLEGDFEVKLGAFPKPFFVAYFMGIAEENMSLVWPGMEGYFPFASDGSGNRYLVNPRETDPNVYFYDHERQKAESLEISLSQFLAVKRTKSRW
jgi:hypothetical protein